MPRFETYRFRRPVAEFFVIFASIVLALFADDWREARSEEEQGLDALELILLDMEGDQDDLEHFQARLAEQERAARTLRGLIDTGGPEIEIVTAFRETVLYWNYEPSYPAYDGLMQSGGLRLIDDAEVNRRVVGYHDHTVPYLGGLKDLMEGAADDLQAGPGRRHFARTPVADGGWRFELLSSPAELAADREFLSALGAAGANANWLGKRIDEFILPKNLEASRVIGAYLEAAGR